MTNPLYDQAAFQLNNGTAGSVTLTGVTIPQTAAQMVEAQSYSGTLAPGTYTRANIVALVPPATVLVAASFTCASGTMDFDQSGSLENLAVGSVIDRPYVSGFSLDDFTLTVDPASTVYVQARGI